MEHAEAVALIREGVPSGGVWADLGAGTGTFTRALVELLGPEGLVYAVDREAEAVEALGRLGGSVIARQADFTSRLELPELDGVLMANALHFSREPETVLRRVRQHLRPGGHFILVEYDQQRGNPWVPYPISRERFRALAATVGLKPPREIGRRRSSFGREMYAALAAAASPKT